MTSTTLRTTATDIFTPPRLTSKRERLVRASDHLWRVQDASGRILGHLRVGAEPQGLRYHAERLHLPSGAFRLVGSFWHADDAVQALRNG
ncbi:hypothetical protein HD600_002779 [Microbacterium ginsengiterrae]|jgi:hypothetical protein|uniref:Uncharacterized protein n=1 Tax=Microbacterium ginsengiterrae TaxID=546115 RepID=A0A7W9FCK9_9MICO|nr:MULTISPECIES: hypothetical protein [Microbacterium]MBB5744282.1 hypothetical protein [Microbacterium ginsengiterrae]